MPDAAVSSRYTGPGVGGRDPEFAEAMARAEGRAQQREEHPKDNVGRTRYGRVIRRDGSSFMPGPYLDLSTLPLVDDVD